MERRTFEPGERRGSLSYMREAGQALVGSVKNRRLILVHCDCGREVAIRLTNWLSGNTTTCGQHRGVHHGTGTPFYKCWQNMRTRAKKVGIDPRWVTFEGFAANPPTAGASPIDGIERNYEPGLCLARTGDVGPYSPENCRWDTRSNNSREQRSSTMRLPFESVVEMRARYAAGEVSQYQLAREYGIHQTQVSNIVRGKQRRTE